MAPRRFPRLARGAVALGSGVAAAGTDRPRRAPGSRRRRAGLRGRACGSAGIEVGDAVDAEHHGLAIDDELRLPDLLGGLDPAIPAGPVMSSPGEQDLTPSFPSIAVICVLTCSFALVYK